MILTLVADARVALVVRGLLDTCGDRGHGQVGEDFEPDQMSGTTVGDGRHVTGHLQGVCYWVPVPPHEVIESPGFLGAGHDLLRGHAGQVGPRLEFWSSAKTELSRLGWEPVPELARCGRGGTTRPSTAAPLRAGSSSSVCSPTRNSCRSASSPGLRQPPPGATAGSPLWPSRPPLSIAPTVRRAARCRTS